MPSKDTGFTQEIEPSDEVQIEVLSRRRLQIYVCLIAALVAAYIPLINSTWQGSTQLHTIMEAVGTLLAFIVGVFALTRYYSRRSNHLLYVGTAFIGTSLLDGYHSIVTSSYFSSLFPSAPPSLIPWS